MRKIMIYLLVICVTLIALSGMFFINFGLSGQAVLAEEESQWIVMNKGLPIVEGFSYPHFSSVYSNEYVYYLFDGLVGSSVGRFNIPGGRWEVLVDEGWTGEPSVIPKSVSLFEEIDTLRLFDFRGIPIGLASTRTKTIYPKNLDIHGALSFFLINDSKFQFWNSRNSYSEYSSRTPIFSWNGVNGDMAFDGDSAIIVGSYGYWLGGIDSTITAVKHFRDDPSRSLKLWNGSGWSGMSTNYRNVYVSIISPNNSDQLMDYPKITYNDETGNYYGILYLGTDKIGCAFRYFNQERWEFWNDDAGWTEDSNINCSDVFRGNISSNLDFEDSSIFSTDSEFSIIFPEEHFSDTRFEISYNFENQEWSEVTYLTDTEDYILKQDNEGVMWLLYKSSLDAKRFNLMKKIDDNWSEEFYFNIPHSINSILDIVFTSENVPILFIQNTFHGPTSIYAYSTQDFNEVPIRRSIGRFSNYEIDPFIEEVDEWENDVNDTWYSKNFAGHLAIDSEGNVYSPRPFDCTLLIYHPDKDPLTEGNFWGGFWDYLLFPGGVAVDNIRNKTYVSDRLTAGGSGGVYGGRVSIFNKSSNNETLFFKKLGGRPVQEKPERIYPKFLSGFIFPVDVAVDENNGFLYVSDSMNHRIQKFDVNNLDQEGKPIKINDLGSLGFGRGEFRLPQSIDVDDEGNLYVVDSMNHRIQKFDSEGNFLLSFGSYGTGQGQLLYPFGISVDSKYNLVYVTDPYQKLQIYSDQGLALYSFNIQSSGVVSDNNGSFYLGVSKRIIHYRINDLLDANNNEIIDVFETCFSDGCNGNCASFCSYGEDLDCGEGCNDGCKNGGETGVDCGAVCFEGLSEENCGDFIDNDHDCLIDCADSDCGEESCDCYDGVCFFGDSCSADCSSEIYCNDFVDNDENGLTDCQEEACNNSLTNGRCEFGAELNCWDSYDNDGDGDVDCYDSDCEGEISECNQTFGDSVCYGVSRCQDGDFLECSATQIMGAENCSDGIDNDCDLLLDGADDECGGLFNQSCLGDIDKNGMVNLVDYLYIRRNLYDSCSFENSWCDFSDINRDGFVDREDGGAILYMRLNFALECNCSIGPEMCDGFDNDCDGSVDEGCDCINFEEKLCENQVGACNGSSITCDRVNYTSAKWGECNILPVVEVCSDSIDNDCDGSVDEGCDSGNGGGGGSSGGGSSGDGGDSSQNNLEGNANGGLNGIRNISESQVINFSLKGETHKITILNLTEEKVIVEIRSDPIIVEILRGEIEKVDVDGDGEDDISLSFEDIVNGEISLKLEIIESSDSFTGMIIMGFVLIVVVILLIMLFKRLRKEEKKEEVLKREIKKVKDKGMLRNINLS
jgi:hypothetical protein